MRGAADVAWTSQAYGVREQPAGKALRLLLATARLIVPVLLLLVVAGALGVYFDAKLSYFADGSGHWLSLSHLLLALGFFALQLTNRRYGSGYAFAQLVLAYLVALAVALFGMETLRELLPLLDAPPMRVTGSFGVAFFVAGFLSIVAFDAMRGPRWWTAPFASSLVGVVTFAGLFHLLAFMGSALWLDHMLIHMALLGVAGLLLLLPYWLLRGAITPLSGFGGY